MLRKPRLLGHTKDGREIWEIMGAADDDTDTGDGDQGDDDEGDDTDTGDDAGDGGTDDRGDAGDQDEDKPLGPKGTKALQAEKDKRKVEADKRRAAEKERDDLRTQLEQAKNGGKDDAAAKAEREATAAALTKANTRILKSEVKLAAKGVLADPKDAFLHLDMTKFEVDEDGEVDEDEIAEALADLVKEKPYLAAQGGKKNWGASDGGPRKAVKSQITRDELKKLSAAERLKAYNEGRLKSITG